MVGMPQQQCLARSVQAIRVPDDQVRFAPVLTYNIVLSLKNMYSKSRLRLTALFVTLFQACIF